MFDEFFHVASKAGEIGSDGWDTTYHAFRRGVSPWFVIGREDTKMTSSNKIVIVER
jgi:hypothetical protein